MQRLVKIKVHIENDKLLNRYSKPYDEKTLKEMEELGEKEYNKLEKDRNDRMMKILRDMEKVIE